MATLEPMSWNDTPLGERKQGPLTSCGLPWTHSDPRSQGQQTLRRNTVQKTLNQNMTFGLYRQEKPGREEKVNTTATRRGYGGCRRFLGLPQPLTTNWWLKATEVYLLIVLDPDVQS